MKARIRLRWWLCALATAGALLVLWKVQDRKREAIRLPVVEDTALETTARLPVSRAPRRWTATTRAVSQRRADRSTVHDEDGGQLRHRSELDRTPDEDQLLWDRATTILGKADL
jgi:hypothetical protein